MNQLELPGCQRGNLRAFFINLELFTKFLVEHHYRRSQVHKRECISRQNSALGRAPVDCRTLSRMRPATQSITQNVTAHHMTHIYEVCPRRDHCGVAPQSTNRIVLLGFNFCVENLKPLSTLLHPNARAVICTRHLLAFGSLPYRRTALRHWRKSPLD